MAVARVGEVMFCGCEDVSDVLVVIVFGCEAVVLDEVVLGWDVDECAAVEPTIGADFAWNVGLVLARKAEKKLEKAKGRWVGAMVKW
jgi:hypothetical protein